MPHLEITEVVLIHSNIVNSVYQQNSIVLYPFIRNKLFGRWLDISPRKFIFLKIFNSEILRIEVWFADQHSKLLEIEDELNMTLVIAWNVKI